MKMAVRASLTNEERKLMYELIDYAAKNNLSTDTSWIVAAAVVELAVQIGVEVPESVRRWNPGQARRL